MKIKNFGANLVFEPANYFAPAGEEEVVSILGRCRGRNIRVVGRLHSWSDAPRGDDVLLDLRHLNRVDIEERDDGVWATIQAGCQIKKVITELDRRAGVTLPSLGLITEQTIAGAVSTGTHGSGKHSLSHYVDEISVATYDAETGEPVIRTIDSGDELLAVRCSLGCMGVILSVGLQCRPQYRVEEHMRIVGDCEDVLAAEEAYPLQQFFLVPFLWKYLTQHRREVATRRSFLAPLYGLYWFLGIDLG
ncbi:MAG: FAD-binding protein, partial [Pirellulaceae bacterium]